MKRSEINKVIHQAIAFMDDHGFKLPPFAYWNRGEWQDNKNEIQAIQSTMLGWDVSDLGGGDFSRMGSVNFTIRNGKQGDLFFGTPYAEKILFLREGQIIPFHYHIQKTEDIINRSGGILCMELYNVDAEGKLDKSEPVSIYTDGIMKQFNPGETLEIPKGASITIPPRIYHSFWTKEGSGDLLCGEVSSINDDEIDNYFSVERERFTSIEEDEPAAFLLCNEYHLID